MAFNVLRVEGDVLRVVFFVKKTLHAFCNVGFSCSGFALQKNILGRAMLSLVKKCRPDGFEFLCAILTCKTKVFCPSRGPVVPLLDSLARHAFRPGPKVVGDVKPVFVDREKTLGDFA